MEVGETIYFKDRREFRSWLSKNYKTKKELWLGIYKKDSGKEGVPYPEAVEEALCFGWIDGIMKSIDGEKHIIRFSPRRKGSVWSSKNIERVKRMIKARKMRKEGLEKVPKGFKADY